MAAILLAIFLTCVAGLDNGLGRTPQMGYNSWYDLYMTPSEAVIRETVQALKSTGLFDAGYRYVNLDDGMVAKQRAGEKLQPDPQGFPSGFKALSDYIHAHGMKFGVYTDRGTLTCGGRPAAEGHEAVDAQTYADWGADYVKEDSCNAPSNHQQAFRQYSLMRDGLNATRRSIFFSLCGWNSWYAPVGHTLGNSWRTGPDDTNWHGILTNIDHIAPLWPFAGPGGWNDPCLLLGRDHAGREAVTDQQGRAQFTMWAILASPMLLSQNVRNLTRFQLETYLNKEVIAIGQDPVGRQGQKLWGGDLAPSSLARGGEDMLGQKKYSKMNKGGDPPLTLQSCTSGQAQTWKWNVTAPFFLTNSQSGLCANVNDCGTKLIGYKCITSGGTCAGPESYSNEQFYLGKDGTISSGISNFCVTQNGVGFSVYIGPCSGSASQQWVYDPQSGQIRSGGGCLTVGGPTGARSNIWGRPLADGSWAIAFINADEAPTDLTCASDCLRITGWEKNQVFEVRDLWAHKDLPQSNVELGITATNLMPSGGVSMYKLKPVWA